MRDHEFYYWLSAQAQRFDAARELTFHLPEPGRYFVEFAVERRDETGSRYSSVEMRDEILNVLESDAGKVIELGASPDEVLAARARTR